MYTLFPIYRRRKFTTKISPTIPRRVYLARTIYYFYGVCPRFPAVESLGSPRKKIYDNDYRRVYIYSAQSLVVVVVESPRETRRKRNRKRIKT